MAGDMDNNQLNVNNLPCMDTHLVPGVEIWTIYDLHPTKTLKNGLVQFQ